MAGDKGAEVAKPLAEYTKKPAGDKLAKDTDTFYRPRGEKTPAMKAAIGKLREAAGRWKGFGKGQPESTPGSQNEAGGVNPNETYAEADRRNDEATAKRFGTGTLE